AELMGLGEDRSPEALAQADYLALVKAAIWNRFPEASGRQERRDLAGMLSSGADMVLREMVARNPNLVGTTQTVALLASDDIDMAVKGKGVRLSDRQTAWLDELDKAGAVSLEFNTLLVTSGDSREPELAGLWGAVVGSFYSLFVTLLVCFPIGVATAVYLEEFAPKNRWTGLIEVNINNLAAVPSVVYGLLGLAIFLNFFGLPRSAPLVGGLVLALISLPTIIIAGRAALKAVPPSIREAAMGLGASKLQMVADHVLPLAMPGLLTGTILGMAHALGETAPLLMIGMVAFIVDIPGGPLDPAAVLPVQVYLWADSPERAFVERTSAAIIVLLVFLALMNLGAILLRKKFEKRW
ncbi:MAG: phosphate ABC transporter permease PstA, partial [Magnetospirillum sp.]